MRPVLLTVDDDTNVLRAIDRDLRRQYGSRFDIFKKL
jgi:thioredoxin reductase (NADPH)